MSSNRDDDHGRGPRRLCEPHDGSRTPSFLPFKRNFKTGLDAIFLHEDDYSLWSAVFGTDQGGDDPNVDDVLCAYNDAEMFKIFHTAFEKRYACKLSDVDNYLGMEVVRDRDASTIKLTQSQYVDKMFNKYLVGENTKKWTTPIDMTRAGATKFYAIQPAESDQEKNAMSGKDFNGLLGSLLYASTMTRPDIAYLTAYLCQFMQAPSTAAWEAGLSVLSYLHTTRELGVLDAHSAKLGAAVLHSQSALERSVPKRLWHCSAQFGSASKSKRNCSAQFRPASHSSLHCSAQFSQRLPQRTSTVRFSDIIRGLEGQKVTEDACCY